MPHVVASERARVRVDAARAWLLSRSPAEMCLVVAGSMEAAHQLVRSRLSPESGTAVFGIHRTTLLRLASNLAGPVLAERGAAVSSGLSTLAVVTRVVHDQRATLGRFSEVADRTGLPRALAQTFHDLRLAGVDPAGVSRVDPDLARLYRAYVDALAELGLADDATILEAAIQVVRAGRSGAGTSALVGLPTLFLDVPLQNTLEVELGRALLDAASTSLATVPAGDGPTLLALEASLGEGPEPSATTTLERVQSRLFEPRHGASDASEEGGLDDGSVVVLSAPGEGRECIEIVRALLAEARQGVPFDQMAILLHDPAPYRARLAEALRRAAVPAYFAEGTRIPDRAGRAFLALLACKADGLSAVRFAEYLSLGEVPEADLETGAPPAAKKIAVAPTDERMAARLPISVQLSLFERPAVAEPPPNATERPVVDGMLKVPRQWERLIVDAAVIGGIHRWRRRLDGLARRLESERAQAEAEDSPFADTLAGNLQALATLKAFALPLLDDLDNLPAKATWRVWCDGLSALASRALRDPERVQTALSELAPMGEVGPVTLGQVRGVLERRLRDLLRPPTRKSDGHVFVGTTEGARGRSFRVVAVPGLAERMFPHKILEDTILLDRARRALSSGTTRLQDNDDRVRQERLSLKIAIGSATDKVIVSYPRVDSERERPRVPSFYCLEIQSVVKGLLPGLDELVQESARRAGASQVGWPAPPTRAEAIDDAEYDLVVLGDLFRGSSGGGQARGAARYLVEVNPHLYRALLARHQRWVGRWTAADGLLKVGAEGKEALARHQISERAFSASALQSYAECPYRFYLGTILKLSPWEIPESVEQMPPAEKGSLIHEVLFQFLGGMRARGALPIRMDGLEEARDELDRILDDVERRYRDDLAPAIERVWQDEVALIRNDLHIWLANQTKESRWTPWRFELSFGLRHGGERDSHSAAEPVSLDGGLRLRGAIDLVEQDEGGFVRATDYKTGRAPDKKDGFVIDGGKLLQPVLYSLALEKLFPDAKVEGGRLHYCTTRGRFEERWVPLDDKARQAALVLTRSLQSDLAEAHLPAAPAQKACAWCDYKPICGVLEEERTLKTGKAAALSPHLQDLRGQR